MTLCCAPACDLTPQRSQRLEQVIQAIPDDDPDLCELMESLGYDDAESAKQGVLAKCHETQQDYRDTCMLCIPGCPYFLRASGGLSWGDNPTESYAILEHVGRCPQAWRIMEEFAREDFLSARPLTPD